MSGDSANQASADRDVFVSYASQDAAVADAVVASLEKLRALHRAARSRL